MATKNVIVRWQPTSTTPINYPGNVTYYRNAQLMPDGYVYAYYVGTENPEDLGLEVVPEYPDYHKLLLQNMQQKAEQIDTVFEVLIYDPNDENKTPRKLFTIDPATGKVTVGIDITVKDTNGNIKEEFARQLTVTLTTSTGRRDMEVLFDIQSGVATKQLTFTEQETGKYTLEIDSIYDIEQDKFIDIANYRRFSVVVNGKTVYPVQARAELEIGTVQNVRRRADLIIAK